MSKQEKHTDCELPQEEPYLYRWDYGTQLAHDGTCRKTSKRRGAVIYVAVLTAVFVCCLAILILSICLFGSDASNTGSEQLLATEEVAERVLPAVVLIQASDQMSSGYGTGFFLRSDGYIVTNAHVIKNRPIITVTLYSGKVLSAKLVGASETDDLAVLKVEGMEFPTVTIGDSDAIRVGERAIALGNPSGTDAPWSVTEGIVSAVKRNVVIPGNTSTVELTMIQTDAPVNSGNSGGPLCNARGEVIGIVTRKLSDYESIGLALPINGCMEILYAIIENGSADGVDSSLSKERPKIGITGGTIQKGEEFKLNNVSYTAGSDGVIITSVERNSPAYGLLQVGDIIVGMNDELVDDMDALTILLYKYKVGDKVRMSVLRDNEKLVVELTLGQAD